MMDLTYADTFKNLDERFVRAVGRLLKPGYVRLCLGDFNNGDTTVLATYQPDVGARSDRKINLNTKALPEPAVVFPIHLSTGQLISLLIDVDPSDKLIGQITQLIAVYVNQHGHLTRSNKDQLTSLKNRRSFDIEYTSLTNSARPEDSDLSPEIRTMTLMRFPFNLRIRRSQNHEEALQRRTNHKSHQAA